MGTSGRGCSRGHEPWSPSTWRRATRAGSRLRWRPGDVLGTGPLAGWIAVDTEGADRRSSQIHSSVRSAEIVTPCPSRNWTSSGKAVDFCISPLNSSRRLLRVGVPGRRSAAEPWSAMSHAPFAARRTSVRRAEFGVLRHRPACRTSRAGFPTKPLSRSSPHLVDNARESRCPGWRSDRAGSARSQPTIPRVQSATRSSTPPGRIWVLSTGEPRRRRRAGPEGWVLARYTPEEQPMGPGVRLRNRFD